MGRTRQSDRFITWLMPMTTQETLGRAVSWHPFGASVVSIEPLTVTEDLSAGSVQRVDAKVVQLAYRADVNTTKRARLDGVDYEIRGVRELGRRRRLEVDLVAVR